MYLCQHYRCIVCGHMAKRLVPRNHEFPLIESLDCHFCKCATMMDAVEQTLVDGELKNGH